MQTSCFKPFQMYEVEKISLPSKNSAEDITKN